MFSALNRKQSNQRPYLTPINFEHILCFCLNKRTQSNQSLKGRQLRKLTRVVTIKLHSILVYTNKNMTYARKNSMSKSMLFVGALLVVLGILDSSVPHASAFHPQPAQPSTGGYVQIQRVHSPSNRLCANDRNTQHTRESNLLPASSFSTRCRTSYVGERTNHQLSGSPFAGQQCCCHIL